MALELSERQARTVATAVTILASVIILLAVGTVIWLIGWFFHTFSSVFLPLAVGAIAALVFRPYFNWLHDQVGVPSPLALTVVFLSVILPLAAFLWFFGSVLAEQLVGLVSQAPEWWRRVVSFVQERWPQVVEFFQTSSVGRQLREALNSQEETVVQGLQIFGQRALSAGADVLRGMGTLLAWAVLPVYFAFFLMTKPRPVDSAKLFPFLKASTREDVMYLVHEFVNIVVAFFRGQLIIAFLQGLLFAIGFSLVGLRYGFIIGLMLGFLNIIPYLGSIVGLSIALPLSFFQQGGGLRVVIAVVIVFAVVQLVEAYLLTPKIMGDRTGLHFMAIIVAVFFWGAALGGIIGMILAIPLTAFLASLWRLAREKYIAELV